jgi:hypothetical protein
MKKAILFIFLAIALSCTKSFDRLPCEEGNYGIIDILNTTDKVHYAAYCRVDNLAEDEDCEGTPVTVNPHMRGAVRLRLAPGEYQVVVQNWTNDKPVLNAWGVTIQRCAIVDFRIEDGKVSLWDQPYHHLAVKATRTVRTSVIPEGIGVINEVE